MVAAVNVLVIFRRPELSSSTVLKFAGLATLACRQVKRTLLKPLKVCTELIEGGLAKAASRGGNPTQSISKSVADAILRLSDKRTPFLAVIRFAQNVRKILAFINGLTH